jgi:hypothetical protein
MKCYVDVTSEHKGSVGEVGFQLTGVRKMSVSKVIDELKCHCLV